MEELLTEETCIPGTIIVVSTKTRLEGSHYFDNKNIGIIEGLWMSEKTEGKIVGALVRWDSQPLKDPASKLYFHKLAIKDVTVISKLLITLNNLEIKLSK